MIQSKCVQYVIPLNLILIMVNTTRGRLIKIQAQSKKLCCRINHVKVVETELIHTITKSLQRNIQVMTNMIMIAIMMGVLTTIMMVIWLGSYRYNNKHI